MASSRSLIPELELAHLHPVLREVDEQVPDRRG
jgi:hypothetical protein